MKLLFTILTGAHNWNAVAALPQGAVTYVDFNFGLTTQGAFLGADRDTIRLLIDGVLTVVPKGTVKRIRAVVRLITPGMKTIYRRKGAR